MQFQWWIEGDDPYLVVVSNSLLGTAAAPCLASPERTAMRLAEHLFGKSDALFDSDIEAAIPEDETSSLDKTGWFEKSRR